MITENNTKGMLNDKVTNYHMLPLTLFLVELHDCTHLGDGNKENCEQMITWCNTKFSELIVRTMYGNQ